MNKKKVDVVIPVYHPGSEFKKLMERLERQTYEVNSIFLMPIQQTDRVWKA